jgi:hypothetical protein
MKNCALTADRARSLLSYDDATGALIWRSPRYPARPGAAGTIKPNGYIYIGIDGKLYLAHRLVFLLKTGKWPVHNVDHIDGCPTNNRWANLRDVPQARNCENIRRATRKNRTGYLGVAANKLRFAAYISLGNKTKYIGIFNTAQQAHDAYLAEKRQVHVGCTL